MQIFWIRLLIATHVPSLHSLKPVDLTEKVESWGDGRKSRSEITIPIMKFLTGRDPGKAAER
jgi:hypothetical protein